MLNGHSDTTTTISQNIFVQNKFHRPILIKTKIHHILNILSYSRNNQKTLFKAVFTISQSYTTFLYNKKINIFILRQISNKNAKSFLVFKNSLQIMFQSHNTEIEELLGKTMK